MRTMWYRRGETDLHLARCGKCKTEMRIDGIVVRIGNEMLALLCGSCFPIVRDAVFALAPHSMVDVDADGELVEGRRSE